MHHQLLVFGGFLALAFSEPVPAQLHAPIKPSCSNHSDAPYPIPTGRTVWPVGISTGIRASPTAPAGSGSYPPISSTTSVGTSISSSSTPSVVSYSFAFPNSTVTVGALSTGGRSSIAISPVSGTFNSTLATTGPIYPTHGYNYTFSLPPVVPSTTGDPISVASSLLPIPTNYSGSAVPLSTGSANGVTYNPLSNSNAPTAPYGNGTATGPNTVYSYTLGLPTGASLASTTSITETVSATLTSTSTSPFSNATLGGTSASSSVGSGSTLNTTSRLPFYPSHGPYTKSLLPTAPSTITPTLGSSASGNSPVQASNTTEPTYPYTFSPTTATESIHPTSFPNTTVYPTSISSLIPSIFSTGTGDPFSSCNESLISTTAPVISSYDPTLPTKATIESVYSYDPTSVTASVPTEYYRHHGRGKGRKQHGGYPWYESGKGYSYDDGQDEYPYGYDGEGGSAYE